MKRCLKNITDKGRQGHVEGHRNKMTSTKKM